MKKAIPKEYDYVRVRIPAKYTGTCHTTVSIKPEEYIGLVRRLRLAPRELNKLMRTVAQRLSVQALPGSLSAAIRNELLRSQR